MRIYICAFCHKLYQEKDLCSSPQQMTCPDFDNCGSPGIMEFKLFATIFNEGKDAAINAVHEEMVQRLANGDHEVLAFETMKRKIHDLEVPGMKEYEDSI